MRIGTGYDVHRLAENRKLILGGVEIAHDCGLEGHSDADVLLHAVMDAMLGAAALGDIGSHFPDTDERYHGISSRVLLRETAELIRGRGLQVVNIDATIIAQAPKLRPYIGSMEQNIMLDLGLSEDQINIKATTEERLGFTGRQEGISAQAVCLLDAIREDI